MREYVEFKSSLFPARTLPFFEALKIVQGNTETAAKQNIVMTALKIPFLIRCLLSANPAACRPDGDIYKNLHRFSFPAFLGRSSPPKIGEAGRTDSPKP